MITINEIDAFSWPFREARKILLRLEKMGKNTCVIASGFGPSGAPHLGTIGEVLRLSYVIRALRELSDVSIRFLVFADDKDGLRRIPDVPGITKEIMQPHLGKSLTSIPDPFGCCPSFGEHNTNQLQSMLHDYNIEYEFMSATKIYESGQMNKVLRRVMQNHTQISRIVGSTMNSAREKEYSPFMPLSPITNRILQVPIEKYDTIEDTITYQEDGVRLVNSIYNGHCKLQWKVDWGARWVAFDVDYEMYGKDLIDSMTLSSQVCSILGGTTPENSFFELFVDENGRKVSKSKGNGIVYEEWLKYGTKNCMKYYMFQSPQSAKKLSVKAIMHCMEEYAQSMGKYSQQTKREQYDNPIWHVFGGRVTVNNKKPLSFEMLINLAILCNAQHYQTLISLITKYDINYVIDEECVEIAKRAVYCYQKLHYDNVLNTTITFNLYEQNIIKETIKLLSERSHNTTHEGESDLQNKLYELAKSVANLDIKIFFETIYMALLHKKHGPRLATLFWLYGIPQSIIKLEKVIDTMIDITI